MFLPAPHFLNLVLSILIFLKILLVIEKAPSLEDNTKGAPGMVRDGGTRYKRN